VLHSGARFGQEVLDDHFLHVSVTFVRRGDCFERGDAIGAVFADADEDARRERDLQFAGPFERVETTLRDFVGRTAMAGKVVAQGLDHHSL